jgi:outer membrane murein-binding lipoprotein Lpp
MIWANSKQKTVGKKRKSTSLTQRSVKLIEAEKSESLHNTVLPPLVNKPVEVTQGSMLSRLFSRKSSALAVAQQMSLDNRLASAFQQLHTTFNQREQQLQVQFQEIKQQQAVLLEQKQKRRRWLIPLAFGAALAGAYMLFVLTNMQNSMLGMTGSIHTMNNHIATMSGDTHTMSQNMQTMNSSIHQLNGNVEQMSTAVKPMGEMAETGNPYLQKFRAFMPF